MPSSTGRPSALIRVMDSGQLLGANFLATYSVPLTGGSTIRLQGVDWTATQSFPVHCFTHLQLQPNGTIFYWDSQSTGEGNGVRWSWRGDLPLGVGDGFQVVGTADGSIQWGAVAWALIEPRLA